eukprot:6209607-Pleurochrysis_carterae.AAC.3
MSQVYRFCNCTAAIHPQHKQQRRDLRNMAALDVVLGALDRQLQSGREEFDALAAEHIAWLQQTVSINTKSLTHQT